jgi:hypothetical protein
MTQASAEIQVTRAFPFAGIVAIWPMVFPAMKHIRSKHLIQRAQGQSLKAEMPFKLCNVAVPPN